MQKVNAATGRTCSLKGEDGLEQKSEDCQHSSDELSQDNGVSRPEREKEIQEGNRGQWVL